MIENIDVVATLILVGIIEIPLVVIRQLYKVIFVSHRFFLKLQLKIIDNFEDAEEIQSS